MEMAKAVQSKEEILKAFVENRKKLLALGVRRLGLFGSFARGDPHPARDVEITGRVDRRIEQETRIPAQGDRVNQSGTASEVVAPSTVTSSRPRPAG